MDETIFLTNRNVMVSSSRIEINGHTFATRNVGSVKLEGKGVSVVAIVLALFGFLMMFGATPVFGACLLAGGGAWAWQSATRRTLKLMAGGGEVVALQTSDRKWAESVRSAIANAIAAR